MSSTDTIYYVLPEGATQEEQWSWESIEEMCGSGQFTADTRIFLPDKNSWIRAGDTELASLFEDAGLTPDDADEDAETTELEAEYQEAIRLAGERPDSPDAHVESGRLAAEKGDRDSARQHFQTALRLQPFNSRIAQEVQRRFSKSECQEFQYLRRDAAVWDDPGELLSFAAGGGVLYFAVPAAVIFVLSLIPHGIFVAGPVCYLWCLQVARHTASGEARPPLWHGILSSPIREAVLPLLAGAAVAGQCVLVVYGVGRLAVISGSGESPFVSVSGSPVLSVALTVVALAYLPAVFVRITHSVGFIVNLLNPWAVLRAKIRMGQEYAISALLALFVTFVLGGLHFVIGGVPVLGKAVVAAFAAVAVPVTGFVLGRLAGRMAHVL